MSPISNSYRYLFILTLSAFMSSCNLFHTDHWKEYTHMRGDFKVDFKGTPEIRNLKDTIEGNVVNIVAVGGMDQKGISYIVEYKDLPEDLINSDTSEGLHFLFAYSMQHIQEELGKESLKSFEQISLNKFPGREIIWHSPAKDTGIHQRIFLVKNKFYIVSVTYPYSLHEDPDIIRFLDSFQLISKKESQKEEQRAKKTRKNYAVKFPGNTKVKNMPSYIPGIGNVVEVLQYYEPTELQFNQTRESNYFYGVSQLSLPEGYDDGKSRELVKLVFNATVERFLYGKVIHYREIEYDGSFWGIEGQGTSDINHLAIHIRAFIIDGNIYHIYVITEKGKQNNTKSLDFFNSFRVY